MQAYLRSDKGMLYLNAFTAGCQLIALGAFVLTILYTDMLPSSLRQRYAIYNDLEGADARPLLPHKAVPEGVAGNDSGWLAAGSGGELECGGGLIGATFVPPADVPRWALPTDPAGLDRLYQNQVRHLATHAVACQLCYPLLSCSLIDPAKEMDGAAML